MLLSFQWLDSTTPSYMKKVPFSAEHSVHQGISPTLKYWPHPFLSRPLQNSKSVRLPLYEQAPLKFWRAWISPLKCTLLQKSRYSFFKETKDFISNNEMRTHLNVEISIIQSKNQRRVRLLLSILFLLGS